MTLTSFLVHSQDSQGFPKNNLHSLLQFRWRERDWPLPSNREIPNEIWNAQKMSEDVAGKFHSQFSISREEKDIFLCLGKPMRAESIIENIYYRIFSRKYFQLENTKTDLRFSKVVGRTFEKDHEWAQELPLKFLSPKRILYSVLSSCNLSRWHEKAKLQRPIAAQPLSHRTIFLLYIEELTV